MTDSLRIEELRRRVESDPASIAFAQLAEEFRRAGEHEEAVRVCRAGLARHPTYMSARVTLGRALMELQHYDEAQSEFEQVLQVAPENLAAIRGLAEVHQRRGNLQEALRNYEIALRIAKYDPELEESVYDLQWRLGGSTDRTATPAASATTAVSDTAPDAGRRTAAPASSEPAVIPLASLSPELEAAADEFTKALAALDALSLDLPGAPAEPLAADEDDQPQDEPAKLEPARSGDQIERASVQAAPVMSREDQAFVADLESWLDAIVRDRSARRQAE